MSSSLDAAVRGFLADPIPCLAGFGKDRYVWPDRFEREMALGMLYARSLGFQIAYIDGLRVRPDGTATILHFAVEAGLERRRIGTCLAYLVAAILAMRYGTAEIVFSQRHPRPHDEAFFRSLGATPRAHPVCLTPDWVWQLP